MKVALVHEMLVKLGGAERVLESLQNMFPEAPIFTLLYDQEKCGAVFPVQKIRTSFLQKWTDRHLPRQLLVNKMPVAVESFDFSGFDLVISSSSAFAHGILTPVNTKHICYCHAPMRYGWDYTHEYVAEKSEGFWSFIKKPLLRRLLSRLREWDIAASDRADLLLANSATTAGRISKFWRKESTVLFPPVDLKRFRVHEEHEGYFLIVSALTRFKKLDLAIEVFRRLPKHRLVIIGEGADRARLEGLATPNIEFLGRKSDADTAEFLQNCRALIFPGLEDFGIVPVEAMACGKPVIAYGHGGVTETVIDGETGVFFSELKPESLEKALTEFFELERLQKFSPQKCRQQAEKFSVEKFEQGIKKAVDRVRES